MATRHAGSVPARRALRGFGEKVPEPSEPGADPVQTEGRRARGVPPLSAAFGGPCMYWGLMRVKSRFIFAYVSYSSRSAAGDKGSALQWSPKNKP